MSQYSLFRSVTDNRLHVLCGADQFEQAPDCLRHQGPWQGMGRGEIATLRMHYRLLLAEQKFVVLYRKLLIPETLSASTSPSDSADSLHSTL